VNRSTPQPTGPAPPVAPVAAPPVPTQPPVQAQAQAPAPAPAPAIPTPEQAELAEITRMFSANKVEEASIKVCLPHAWSHVIPANTSFS
jgi:hypothetical protein